MAEYIEREAALSCFHDWIDWRGDVHTPDEMEEYRALESLPAADVRPVVTCAECQHNNACLTQAFVEDCGKIPLDRNTFFCSDGEKKEM